MCPKKYTINSSKGGFCNSSFTNVLLYLLHDSLIPETFFVLHKIIDMIRTYEHVFILYRWTMNIHVKVNKIVLNIYTVFNFSIYLTCSKNIIFIYFVVFSVQKTSSDITKTLPEIMLTKCNLEDKCTQTMVWVWW